MMGPLIRQTWAVLGVLLNMLGQGMVLSYTSCLLPALQAPDSDIKIDIHTASWIASCIAISGFGGFTVSSILMDVIGRKKAHAIVLIPGILGWVLISLAQNVYTIVIGRLLGGFAASATVCLGAVVIGEYSSPTNRGTFLNLKTAAVCFGNMVIHMFGNFYHWRTIALIATIPHLLSFAIIMTWPESPSWLASKNQYEESSKSFEWLRGTDDAALLEFEELIRAQKERVAEKSVKTSLKMELRNFFQKFTRRDFVKPLVIIIFSSALLETCGRHIFPAYALQIITEVTGSKSNSFYYTLAIDIIITSSALFSSVLVKLMKRRTLLLGTGAAAYVVLMTVCSYLFVADRGWIISRTWIPISLFVLYFILANLGCTPIPLALLGEVFPLPHRAAGSLAAGFIMSLILLFPLQVTPYLLTSIKVYGTFFFFGTLMGLALLVLYFILPETKDRTLQEIEDYFNNGRFKEKTDDAAHTKMLSNKAEI
ncbi:facilitated trehalose transporter Tret1-like [Pieris rapae]|uniref:facilitated trehalose transporter Tret1-like n=1 Tax=Pieris rapae TaxID=64459 RepID=UPI001E27E967|nr:facilitated trehalose transporter Tret1-like [Pieris rapae]